VGESREINGDYGESGAAIAVSVFFLVEKKKLVLSYKLLSWYARAIKEYSIDSTFVFL